MAVTILVDRARRLLFFLQHVDDYRTRVRLNHARERHIVDFITTELHSLKELTDDVRVQLLRENNLVGFEEDSSLDFAFQNMREE